MFAILCSDGAVKPEDIVGQSGNEQLVPLAVTKPRGNPNGTPTLLLFDDEETAKKFAKRNFPSDWLLSVVMLPDADCEWVKERGWNVEKVPYAKRMGDHPDYELTYAVLEFKARPDVVRGRL